MRDRKIERRGWQALLIWRLGAVVLVALGLYGRTARFEFSYLDDDVLVVDDRPFLSAPGNLPQIFRRAYFPRSERQADHAYYRPLVTASYAIDARTGGTAPRFHLTNVFLHAVAAALLLLLLRRFGYADSVATWGALLFAVHPALTETVAWIPGRNDSLLTLFALLAWLTLPGWDRHTMQQPPGSARPPTRGWVMAIRSLVHFLALVAALFTKETALILPVVWASQMRWLEHHRWRAVLRPSLLGGWLAALGLYVAARANLASGVGEGASGATAAALWSGLSIGRLVSNLPLLVGALGKLILPVHLSVLATPADTWLWPGFVGAAALLLAARLSHVRRLHILFGVACVVAFLLPSLPASNLLILENRLYLPAVGIALVFCELSRAIALSPRARTFPGAIATVTVPVLAVLAVISFCYTSHFSGRMAFAQAAAEQSPHSSLAHRNLGVAHHIAGNVDLARHEYEAALAEDAAEPVAHNNLGVLFMAKGQLAEAERELRQELAINPNYAPAHHNLAQVLSATGRLGEAADHWGTALALNRDDIAAKQALLAYYATRDPTRAATLRDALEGHGTPGRAP